jgi:hypothetical protein
MISECTVMLGVFSADSPKKKRNCFMSKELSGALQTIR